MNFQPIPLKITFLLSVKSYLSFEGMMSVIWVGRILWPTSTSYSNRLQLLKLDSLEHRRIKFDLIVMYKIYHNLMDLNFEEFFSDSISSSNYSLRGHNCKLYVPRYSGSSVRQNFYANRVVSIWNQLPTALVDSPNLQIFKFRLNRLELWQQIFNFS